MATLQDHCRHKWRPCGIVAAINGDPGGSLPGFVGGALMRTDIGAVPAGNSSPIVENRHKKSGPESAFLLQGLPYA